MKHGLCSSNSLDRELDGLRDALLKARLDSTSPKAKSPGISLSKLIYKNKRSTKFYAYFFNQQILTYRDVFFKAVKISPGKQSQLRNFLSKGQMPPVRSTAPGTQL